MCYVTYGTSIALFRISIGLFLLRFAIERIHQWIIYITMLSTVIFWALSAVFLSLLCNPLDNNRHCLSAVVEIHVSYLYSAAAIVIDLVFVVFPIFLTWSLSISRRTKVMLVPIFGMGFLYGLTDSFWSFSR